MNAGDRPGAEPDGFSIGVAIPNLMRARREMRAQLDALSEALSAVTGVPVVMRERRDYKDLVAAMRDGELDVAWLPPIVALRAAESGHAVPIAIPVRGGESTVSTALFSRAASHVRTVADLWGLSAAWVHRESAAGCLLIRASLRARGVDLTGAFQSEMFLGSHDTVVEAVLRGAADVGATFAHFDASQTAILRAGWGHAKVNVIAHAGPIPADILAASPGADPTRLQAVQRGLCEHHDERLGAAIQALFDAEALVPATAEHLGPLRGLLGYMEETARKR